VRLGIEPLIEARRPRQPRAFSARADEDLVSPYVGDRAARGTVLVLQRDGHRAVRDAVEVVHRPVQGIDEPFVRFSSRRGVASLRRGPYPCPSLAPFHAGFAGESTARGPARFAGRARSAGAALFGHDLIVRELAAEDLHNRGLRRAIGVEHDVGRARLRRQPRRPRTLSAQHLRPGEGGMGRDRERVRERVVYRCWIRPSTLGSTGECAVRYAATTSTSMSP